MKFVKDTETTAIAKIKNGEKDVAKPASWGKKLEDYKLIPQNVVAMSNWNILERKTFGAGSKAYLFKIQGLNPDLCPQNVYDNYTKEFVSKGIKLKEIAIPENQKELPPYYIVDVKLMLEYCWTARWKILLGPILQVEEDNKILMF